MSEGVSDPGLQPERTAMAWTRTGLAVVVGSLLAVRLLAPRAGGAALVVGGAGLLAGLLLLATGAGRHRGQGAAPGRSLGGGMLAAVAAGCVLLASAGLAAVVVPLL